jgi:4-amino-4-deoxy-L-arabinose transferase-like glycosyltransferase
LKTRNAPAGICFLLLAAWSSAAIWFFFRQGALYDYGDAEAHLNMARRIFDSQTPRYDMIGRIWLPLPHLLMMPLARVDSLWHNGLAGAIPSAACFVAAGLFLFGAVRRLFGPAAAAASVALFATNPNLLYLQSTAMTEAVFAACLLAVLYSTVRFRQTQGWLAVVGAGIAACLGALTRYEGWFVIPFVAAYFLLAARKRRVLMAALFSFLAVLGTLWWLGHNWWLTGDVLDFYRGPNSALSIQGSVQYPGRGNWRAAWVYYRTAAQMCAGPGLFWAGAAGVVAALLKRAFWPLILLALPGCFYVWSVHSTAVPIFVPTLWPNTLYNTRYGVAVLPLLAFASGALVALIPQRARKAASVVVVAGAVASWAVLPRVERWVTWREAEVNSQGRRQWVHEAAEYLQGRYVRGSGIITSFGDMTAIFREMGLPLRETFTADSDLPWFATVKRPDLFLRQQWAVSMGGDEVQSAVNRAARYGIRYRLEKMIVAGREPVIEIYRRVGGPFGPQTESP